MRTVTLSVFVYRWIFLSVRVVSDACVSDFRRFCAITAQDYECVGPSPRNVRVRYSRGKYMPVTDIWEWINIVYPLYKMQAVATSS